jgi:hypothetical protein
MLPLPSFSIPRPKCKKKSGGEKIDQHYRGKNIAHKQIE